MPSYKIRITSEGPEDAELLREALGLIFGDALKLAKARKGSNPKYEHLPNVLAYGTLEIEPDALKAVIKRNKRRVNRTLSLDLEPKPKRKRAKP